jgi:hypothetical protein
MSPADGQRVHDTLDMIVQFPEAKLHGAYHAADTLEPLLQESGLACLDGTDIGGGKINL